MSPWTLLRVATRLTGVVLHQTRKLFYCLQPTASRAAVLVTLTVGKRLEFPTL
jgi:hypothetical protein